MNDSREELNIADIALLAITRVALGAGIGLLIAKKLGKGRQAAGWALLSVGIATTVPLAVEVFSGLKACRTRVQDEATTE